MSNEVLKQKIDTLPTNSGVYIMKDSGGKIIYIGKAKSLKNRVRQYFQKSARHNPKVAAMVANISDFDLIITGSEIEALVLECNLIKEHKPKYNILLKDDKKFPFIKLTNDPFPRLIIVRNTENDGGRYFGPYPSSYLARQMVEMVKKLFALVACDRRISEQSNAQRPCLYHSIKRCHAPCVGAITPTEYAVHTQQAVAFLDGNHDKLIAELNNKMQEASNNLEFERAAALRDRIRSIEQICERQVVQSANGRDMDLFGVASQDGLWVFELFYIRGGKVLGCDTYKMEGFLEVDEAQALDEFMSQYYQRTQFIPPIILLPFKTEGCDVLAQHLREKRNGKVVISVPQRGELRQCVTLAQNNAKKALSDYIIQVLSAQQKDNALKMLAEAMGITPPPQIIEAYDISNTQGADNVAAMVVFADGAPKKSMYKKFKIKYVSGADDYASMYEVILRRLERYKSGSKGFDYLPNVILVDGGIGQVHSAQKAMEVCGIHLPVFGMKKDDKHTTNCLVSDGGEIELKKTLSHFRLLTQIQNEVHRFAITYHKQQRKKSGLESELSKIKGVGEVRRKMLQKHFKSLNAIKNASVSQLENAGLDKKTAQNVFDYFKI